MTLCYNDISGLALFSGLSQHDLERITDRMQKCVFLSGMAIMTRDAPVEELYIILSGTARVELHDDSGRIFNVTELTRGDLIGERAVLTDEPRTANVRAVSKVLAARLARRDFEELLHETPLLYANLCRKLARQLGSWAERHQREEREHRDVITNVIGWQLMPEFGEFPGRSPWVRTLNRRLQILGKARTNLLIVGEPGTWKDLAARLIHFHNTPCPVLFLDCASPPPLIGSESSSFASPPDTFSLQNAQEAALFGHSPDGTGHPPRDRRGMLELANGGDIILRNIDCLSTAVQQQLFSFMESGLYRRRGENRERSSQVRVLATSSEELQPLVDKGTFVPQLYNILQEEVLLLLPLRERKEDIPVIARSLLKTLNAKHHRQVRRFSQDALNRLVDHDWPLNGSELYQVVSRAVVTCSDEEIQAEQIFLQGQPFGDGRFNLLTIPQLEKIARKPGFPRFLRWSTVPLFLLVTFSALFGPREQNAANLAVWTLWWPALLLTAFLFARSWCSFCPLEAIGEFAGVKTRVTHEPMQWLRRSGTAISLAGLVSILLIEQASGMFSQAFATGLLLAGLLTATVTADSIIGRRGWCKFLCPLGRIVSLVSRISLLEMHSNHNVCVSRCRVDDCIKEHGCPMGLHPTGINNSDHCVLCLNCVRNCPHHSMQLDLRNPAWGLFNQTRHGVSEALFSVTLVGAVLAAKGAPLLGGHSGEVFPQRIWTLTESALAVAIVAVYTTAALLVSKGTKSSSRKQVFTIYGSAYLPLAFAGLFMIYFRALVEGGAQLVPMAISATGLASILDSAALTPELGTLRLFIHPTILMAALFSWVVLGRLQRQHKLSPVSLTGHRLLIFMAAALFLSIL